MPDFDDLIVSSSQSSDDGAQKAVWNAILDLDTWHFIGDGERPKAPVVTTYKNMPTVLAFTDREHAQRYATARNVVDQDGNAFHIPMDVGQARPYLRKLMERGVRWILFNVEPAGIGAELEEFLLQAEQALDHQVARCFDELVTAARRREDEQAAAPLWEAALSLPKWHFVGDRDIPDRPFIGIVREEPAVFAFTDQIHALQFAKDQKIQLEDGTISVLSYSTGAALDWLIRMHESHGVPRAVFNMGEHCFVGSLKNFPAMKQRWLQLQSTAPRT